MDGLFAQHPVGARSFADLFSRKARKVPNNPHLSLLWVWTAPSSSPGRLKQHPMTAGSRHGADRGAAFGVAPLKHETDRRYLTGYCGQHVTITDLGGAIMKTVNLGPERGIAMREIVATRRLVPWIFLIGLFLLFGTNAADAQPYPVPPTWGGDMLDRPRLTGDWSGWRDELGKMGIVVDLDLLLTPQVNIAGGRNTGGNFWGNIDYTLNIDTQKAGLWRGGFFKFEADTGFGSNIFHDVGAIVPVNTAALLPGINDRTTALTNATLMQFLSPQFGLAIGKINTLDLGVTEFYGDYRTQFMNAAFNFPMILEQVPLSTFGGGVIALPREDIILSALALD